MRVALVQSKLVWEQPAVNRTLLANKLKPLHQQVDLIVLPEMCTTGFSMHAQELAEPMGGPTTAWFLEQARESGAVVTGSFICQEGNFYFNRLIWARPDGELAYYDKRHLFSLAGEHLTYSAGQHQPTMEWKGWRVRPLICYDLRFPVWSRQPREQEDWYDLLLYVANWPNRRSHHWKSLLMARAIENQCYTLGLNIVGEDGNGHLYSGDSAVIDFSGQYLAQVAWEDQTIVVELDLAKQQAYRMQFPFLEDADIFSV
jgi:predicted amidohydrolase